MKIVTIIENNPITGVRYGTVEAQEYNNNVKRKLDKYYRARSKATYITTRFHHTKHK